MVKTIVETDLMRSVTAKRVILLKNLHVKNQDDALIKSGIAMDTQTASISQTK